MLSLRLIIFALIASLAQFACEKRHLAQTSTLSELAARGKSVYSAQCTACHNSDPRKAGSLGPEIQASSRELLEARLLRAEYPEGYQPKRNTRVMQAMPQLKSEVDALHAYLNSP